VKRRRRLPVREVAAGLAILATAILAVAVIFWINIDRMVAADAGDRQSREVLAESGSVDEAMLEQETGLRGYVATGNPAFLKDIELGRAHLSLALPRLAALTAAVPVQHGRVDAVAALSAKWTSSIAAPEVALVQAGALGPAQAMVRGRSGERQMHDMFAVIAALRDQESATLAQRADAQAQSFVTARWALVLAVLAAIAAGGALGAHALRLLVRSRSRAEAALARAQAASQAKTTFLANMSHEIRTPLNGVAGMAEALARTGLDAGQQALVETIRRSAEAVDAILADVLTVSRGHSDADVAEVRAFDLADLVHGLLASHRPAADAKGLTLGGDVPGAANIAVEGDAPRLRRILASFLSNAVKFTDQGSVRLTVTALPDDGYRFEVRDTGIGFDAAAKARLFDAFRQFDTSFTRRHGGMGLGLAVAQLAAGRIGGRLNCASVPGEGSTFSLELTLSRAAAAAGPTAANEAEEALRVLIVDDHATNRQVLEVILDQCGIDRVSVENGREAVEAVRAQDFSAILMDIQMPVMDGLTATREIRRFEREVGRPREPVIIVSANCQPEHVRLGEEAGAQRHLGKPVRAQQLLQTLSDVLEEQPRAA
jgi:signal transduction histidine kinase/CheY-like chemotaxis protein